MQFPLKHFKLAEFDSPDAPGSGAKMQPKFLQMLDNARSLAKVAFKINSGYRTEAHNAKVKGVKESSHCQGWAADIHCTDGNKRFVIIDSLLKSGITRIGVSSTFIHADCDPNKPAKVIWTY
jgi:uncharacterized protein YcbK (DUF882 family)